MLAIGRGLMSNPKLLMLDEPSLGLMPKLVDEMLEAVAKLKDAGKTILEVCREHNISEVSFHRWKQQFGQLEVNEARRLKELERENGELKKMLAEALLKNRVLEAVCEKKL